MDCFASASKPWHPLRNHLPMRFLFGRHRISGALLAWVRRFEKRYSRYLPDSLISRINHAAGTGQSIPIEEEDDRLFKICDTLHFFTHGLFDPTTLLPRQDLGLQGQEPEDSRRL